MDCLIKLESRYPDVNTTFRQIDDNCGIITSDGAYVRCTMDETAENITAVDFEGSPMLFLGDTIANSNKKIKRIKSCFYIELE